MTETGTPAVRCTEAVCARGAKVLCARCRRAVCARHARLALAAPEDGAPPEDGILCVACFAAAHS